MDPRIVSVYVDGHAEQVTPEDIVEWLSFLDEIDDIRLQFNALEKCTFYAIKFRHPTAAHQAVVHLNGERLKNCVVRIVSDVYAAPQATEEERGETITSSSALPHNHLVPREFSMCPSLTEFCGSVSDDTETFKDGAAVMQQLRDLQTQWCATNEALQHIHSEIKKVSAQFSSTHHSDSGCNALCSNPIPFSDVAPHVLLSTISEAFGPIEQYSCCSDHVGFTLTFQFMMKEDEDAFMLSGSKASEQRKYSFFAYRWVTTSLCYSSRHTSTEARLSQLLN